MTKLVSIGIPVYTRLNFLSHVLKVVQAQDYPSIELIVSDNGMNGSKVQEIVNSCYDRPYTFRQNSTTVSISTHFNQIVQEATGEYFVLLADDDEISWNYVSELVRLLEQNPQASIAIAKQEIMNEAGSVIRSSENELPTILSGPEFIRAAWQTYQFRHECFATFLARTEHIQRCGGYPDFTLGSHNDNALLIKLCLNGFVVFSPKCAFRWRVYESSHGWSISIQALSQASRQFLEFLDSDPTIQKFASTNKTLWEELKSHLVVMTWYTYLERWQGMYRKRLSYLQWVRAAFTMPFIPSYYQAVTSVLFETVKMAARLKIKSVIS